MPEFDAFDGGVEIGGLRSKNEIRVLVCYILNSVKAPLSKEDVIKILQDKQLANYFEVNDAISSMKSLGNITEDENGNLNITDTGKEIADTLDVTLPLAVRDKALEAAFSMLAATKIERENAVDIERTDEGYNVTCHISGGKLDLMAFKLYVPDLYQARMVKKNFHKDPESIYKLLLASVTGNRDLTRLFLSNEE